jgi:hypothetical protein
MRMKVIEYTALVCVLLSMNALAEKDDRIDVAEYWFMPGNLVAKTCNITWSGDIIFGEHCFWNGEFLGRKCFLQGDPSMSRYDIFELKGESINYWGTFRGNSTNDAVSHSLKSPMLWMREQMSIGDKVKSRIPVQVLNPKNRSIVHSGEIDMHLELNKHYETWTLPETGVSYDDVIKISFWSDSNRPQSKEVYHLARGQGTIRFITFNKGEPSGVRAAWTVEFRKKNINKPITPWFDIFEEKEK